MAATAEIDIAMKAGLHELVACFCIAVWPQFVASTTPKRKHAAAVVAFAGIGAAVVVCIVIRAVGRERYVHHTCVFAVIRVSHCMAGVAVDTVVVTRCEAGAIRRGGATAVPAAGTVATNTEVPSAIEILLGYRQCGPEHRITPGITHCGAAPACSRFNFRVYIITGMAVITSVRRFKIADFVGLGARHLDFGWYNIRCLGSG